MKVIGIYKITSPSGKIYIGQSVNCYERFKCYKRYACKSQSKLYASLKKYGSENHTYEILEECSIDDLSSKEKYYVDLFSSFNTDHGLNVRDGGGNRAKLSDDQKRKISNSLRGVKHSPERIDKNRKSQLGKKLSEEHKNKIRLNSKKPNLGKKASVETREKQRIAHLGQKNRLGKNHTEETKSKLSEMMSGSKNPNFGKKRTEESKSKTSESLKKYWNDKRAKNS